MTMLSEESIGRLGFASIGCGVLISDRASFYGVSRIEIGDHVRIDDFCVISAGEGGVKIGSYVHIGVGSTLIGAGEIIVGDFVNISSRVAIYSSSDDYSGVVMTGPMVPSEFTKFDIGAVRIGRHVIVGSGSVVLPGVELADGVAVGALSLVKQSCDAFGIYGGNPARWLKARKRDLLELEKDFFSRVDF